LKVREDIRERISSYAMMVVVVMMMMVRKMRKKSELKGKVRSSHFVLLLSRW
jgi:hypothetical protein